MKNKILVLVFIGFLTLASFSIASSANYSNPGDDSCCCCCPTSCKKMCVMGCEDVEVNVENVKDGVVVKVTSKNEEVVKKVQEMCANMKEMCAQKDCCKEEGSKKDKVKN
jgi:hypothetical protein